MPTKPAATDTPANTDTANPTTATIVKPVKDADGNEWTVTKTTTGVEVTYLGKDGRQLSTTAATEQASRDAITAYLSL